MKIPVTLIVNGQPYAIEAEAHHTLLEVLRDNVGLTGTKECCAEGECGACTVLLNGRSVDSCIVLGVEADGKEVTTVEGLAADGTLSALQQAFLDTGAVQCGFCIPGMLMSARHLLDTNPNPTEDDIKRGLEGNLCRCAGYSRIIAAVFQAARAERGESIEPRPHGGGHA